MQHLLSIFLTSCIYIACSTTQATKNTKIQVYNNSGQKIDSVVISSYGTSETYSNILPATAQKKTLKVNDVNYEGAFKVSVYYKNGLAHASTFGYFARAKDIKQEYSISISRDFSIGEQP